MAILLYRCLRLFSLSNFLATTQLGSNGPIYHV
jgi:hypothetical protein